MIIPGYEDYLKENKNRVMIVPHIIPVECATIDQFTPVSYQMKIQFDEVPLGFLFTGIHSRYPIDHVRIMQGDTVLFSAPGWFVYAFHDHKLEPALFVAAKSRAWDMHVLHHKSMLDIDIHPKHLEFAIIGQKVVDIP